MNSIEGNIAFALMEKIEQIKNKKVDVKNTVDSKILTFNFGFVFTMKSGFIFSDLFILLSIRQYELIVKPEEILYIYSRYCTY